MVGNWAKGTVQGTGQQVLLTDQYINRPQHEALGNNYRVCGVYSAEPRAEVYCLRLNFNISKLVYSTLFC